MRSDKIRKTNYTGGPGSNVVDYEGIALLRAGSNSAWLGFTSIAEAIRYKRTKGFGSDFSISDKRRPYQLTSGEQEMLHPEIDGVLRGAYLVREWLEETGNLAEDPDRAVLLGEQILSDNVANAGANYGFRVARRWPCTDQARLVIVSKGRICIDLLADDPECPVSVEQLDPGEVVEQFAHSLGSPDYEGGTDPLRDRLGARLRILAASSRADFSGEVGIEARRRAAAEFAFEQFDFGDLEVLDTNGWIDDGENRLRRRVFFEGGEEASVPAWFAVEMGEGGGVTIDFEPPRIEAPAPGF